MGGLSSKAFKFLSSALKKRKSSISILESLNNKRRKARSAFSKGSSLNRRTKFDKALDVDSGKRFLKNAAGGLAGAGIAAGIRRFRNRNKRFNKKKVVKK